MSPELFPNMANRCSFLLSPRYNPEESSSLRYKTPNRATILLENDTIRTSILVGKERSKTGTQGWALAFPVEPRPRRHPNSGPCVYETLPVLLSYFLSIAELEVTPCYQLYYPYINLVICSELRDAYDTHRKSGDKTRELVTLSRVNLDD